MIISYLKYKTFPQLLLMCVCACMHVCICILHILFASSSENHLNAEYWCPFLKLIVLPRLYVNTFNWQIKDRLCYQDKIWIKGQRILENNFVFKIHKYDMQICKINQIKNFLQKNLISKTSDYSKKQVKSSFYT